MTDIDPNSPANLRALMLYDISQRKTMRETIENHRVLCKHLGKKAILYIMNMSFVSIAVSMRTTILLLRKEISRFLISLHASDVINGKSAEKSIDDLCDAFKNQKIYNKDHDYWFNRFKYGQSFTRVTFSDFPEDILAEIVERCDINLNLRNVSHGLRIVIDQLRPPCTDIGVYCECGIKAYGDDTLIADSEHFDILELLLRNPKLRLKRFGFYEHKFSNELSYD